MMDAPERLTAAEFKDRYAKPGYAWTMNFSYFIGAHIAFAHCAPAYAQERSPI